MIAGSEGLHECNPNHTQSYDNDSLPRLPPRTDAVNALDAAESIDFIDTIEIADTINAVDAIEAVDTVDTVDTIDADLHVHGHSRRHVASFNQSYKLAPQLLH